MGSVIQPHVCDAGLARRLAVGDTSESVGHLRAPHLVHTKQERSSLPQIDPPNPHAQPDAHEHPAQMYELLLMLLRIDARCDTWCANKHEGMKARGSFWGVQGVCRCTREGG
jgi:hypothetical protein